MGKKGRLRRGIFRKEPEIHNCPRCGLDWDMKSLGWKESNARKMAFMGPMIHMGLAFLPNPFHNLLPGKEENPEEWCSPCLREYMNLDDLSMDWPSLGLKPKEEENQIEPTE